MTGAFPNKWIVNVDGVEAFDHACRAKMFDELMSNTAMPQPTPFIRQWYGDAPQFQWRDDNGTARRIYREIRVNRVMH